VAERLGVMPGGGAEAADFPHVLQRGGADVVVGHLVAYGGRRVLMLRHMLRRYLGLLESEQSLQAHGEAGREGGHAADGEQHPGMNEARSSESCLIVSVSPVPPNSTS